MMSFFDRFPAFDVAQMLLEESSEFGEMRTILGIWKPIYMSTPVCDKPLAVMDAQTFREEEEVSFILTQ